MPGALTDLRNRLEHPEPALRAIGLYMVGQAQGAFRAQGRGGVSWLPRSVPNRMGVLQDLQAGRNPPARRWDPTPAGVDTGRLRSSIAFRLQRQSVVVGSVLPYASDVQLGSTTTVQVDGELRARLAAWLRGLGQGLKARARESFGFMFHTRSYTVSTPPRPFLAVTPEDRRVIVSLAKNALLGR